MRSHCHSFAVSLAQAITAFLSFRFSEKVCTQHLSQHCVQSGTTFLIATPPRLAHYDLGRYHRCNVCSIGPRKARYTDAPRATRTFQEHSYRPSLAIYLSHAITIFLLEQEAQATQSLQKADSHQVSVHACRSMPNSALAPLSDHTKNKEKDYVCTSAKDHVGRYWSKLRQYDCKAPYRKLLVSSNPCIFFSLRSRRMCSAQSRPCEYDTSCQDM